MPSVLRRASSAVAVAVVLTAGCAAPPPPPPAQMTLPFNAGDLAWSAVPGSGSVEGRAAIAAAGGPAHTCAGGEAQLFPAGAYAAEMMRIVFGNDIRGYAPMASQPRYPANIAPDFKNTVRRIGCDADGRFRFDNVPPGRWYVFANVVWRGAGSETAAQGGALMQRVDVIEGARANVTLSP